MENMQWNGNYGILCVLVCICVLAFYVTCNDISVIYVTAQMCRRTEEEVVPMFGLPTP